MTLVLIRGKCIYRKRHTGSMTFENEAVIRVMVLEAGEVPGVLAQDPKGVALIEVYPC